MRLLVPPKDLLEDETRREVLRAWIDGGRLSISLVRSLPDYGSTPPSEIWAMFLSDIGHHVIDAINLDSGFEKREIRFRLKDTLLDLLADQRGVLNRSIHVVDREVIELGIKNVSGTDDSTEMVRVFTASESVRIIIRVGMWYSTKAEEKTWANLLYDMSHMITSTLVHDRLVEDQRNEMIRSIIGYLDNPNTTHDGHYF